MSELTSQPTSVQSLYGLHQENKLFVNRRYQRKLVWTLAEKQKLVDSILRKYPIPAILVAERKNEPGNYEIIDGLQRLHAIISFIETSFPSLDGYHFAIEHYPTAKARADEGKFLPTDSPDLLTPAEVSRILDYTLAMTVMRNASEDEVNDVFGRINTYGHRLSDQERRQAGVQNAFSDLVRNIACSMRGDVSADTLHLEDMPSISIDLPMTKHGYQVKADEVVWVSQGILRATELRDSLDEQCIADVIACIAGGSLIERSKDALDSIYSAESDESSRIINALDVYGAEKFAEEFKYCLDQILKACSGDGNTSKLREILFTKTNTNSFPSVFAVLMIAFHELIVMEKKIISDYPNLKRALNNIASRLETSRSATTPVERRKNVDTIKGLINTFFVPSDISAIYGNHATTDIDAIIRRSEIELPDYELKQGLASLSAVRAIDINITQKIVNTICAIANNGPGRAGKIILGVTDKDSDADRVKKLDGIEPRKVGRRFVVGVKREAIALGLTMEQYIGHLRDEIKKSALSSPLKEDVLSNFDYNEYYGLGVITLTIPPQAQVSTVGEDLFFRQADETIIVTSMRIGAAIGGRFSITP